MQLKPSFCLLLLLFISASLNGQRDYYITQKEMNYGAYLVKGKDEQNARICRVRNDKLITTFNTENVVEYGFRDGRVYKLKAIYRNGSFQKYFLEELSNGKLNLYYLNDGMVKSFFLEDSTGRLTEFNNISNDGKGTMYHKVLADITADFESSNKNSILVSFRKSSMKEFINMYNSRDPKPFQFLQYGFFSGIDVIKYSQTFSQLTYLNFRLFEFKPIVSSSLGVFIDKPLYTNNLSIHAETYFSSQKTEDHKTRNGTVYEIKLKTAGVTIPFLVRYTFPYRKISPFINAGVVYTKNFNNSNSLTETSSSGILDFSNMYNIVPRNLIGICGGAGIKINTSIRNNLFIELRMTQRYGVLLNEYLKMFNGGISVGYNF